MANSIEYKEVSLNVCFEESYDTLDAHIDNLELQEAVEKILESLTPRERTVLEMFFGFYSEPKTHKEIGELLGLSVNQVVEINREALKKLRCPSRASVVSSYY